MYHYPEAGKVEVLLTGVGLAGVGVALELGSQGEGPRQVVLGADAVGPGAVAARFERAEHFGFDGDAVHAEPPEDGEAVIDRVHGQQARVDGPGADFADAARLGL